MERDSTDTVQNQQADQSGAEVGDGGGETAAGYGVEACLLAGGECAERSFHCQNLLPFFKGERLGDRLISFHQLYNKKNCFSIVPVTPAGSEELFREKGKKRERCENTTYSAVKKKATIFCDFCLQKTQDIV